MSEPRQDPSAPGETTDQPPLSAEEVIAELDPAGLTYDEFVTELARKRREWRRMVLAMPDLLTAEEAGIVGRFGLKTIQAMARRGEIEGAVKIGKEWRFPKDLWMRQLKLLDEPAEE